jgi:hypothetical protein
MEPYAVPRMPSPARATLRHPIPKHAAPTELGGSRKDRGYKHGAPNGAWASFSQIAAIRRLTKFVSGDLSVFGIQGSAVRGAARQVTDYGLLITSTHLRSRHRCISPPQWRGVHARSYLRIRSRAGWQFGANTPDHRSGFHAHRQDRVIPVLISRAGRRLSSAIREPKDWQVGLCARLRE